MTALKYWRCCLIAISNSTDPKCNSQFLETASKSGTGERLAFASTLKIDELKLKPVTFEEAVRQHLWLYLVLHFGRYLFPLYVVPSAKTIISKWRLRKRRSCPGFTPPRWRCPSADSSPPPRWWWRWAGWAICQRTLKLQWIIGGFIALFWDSAPWRMGESS